MKRAITIGVRVNDEELAALAQLAEQVERTIPDTLRWLARRATKQRAASADERDGAFVMS